MTKEITKDDILKDIIKANRKYQIEYDTTNFISRNIYRDNYKNSYSKYAEACITKIFGSWAEASKQAKKLFMAEAKSPVEDTERLNYEKKIIVLNNLVKRLTKEKKILIHEQVDEENLITSYVDTILPKREETKKITKLKENKEVEAILMLSDIHSSEVVIADEMENINEYNLDIMVKRLDKIFNYFYLYCANNKVTKANIYFLGDLFTGDIHDELIRTNELNVVETQFLLLDYFIAKFIEMEKLFSSINVEVITGNHGRFKQGKPEFKTSAILNWEYIFAENLRRTIGYINLDKKIKINVNRSLFKCVEVQGRKFLLLHGHVLTGSGTGGFAGIPFYGLAMSSAKFYGVLDQKEIGLTREIPFHDILMGHLHSKTVMGLFNGGTLYINGCIIGTNEYSLFKIRSVAKIEQTMLLVSEGKVIGNYTLWGT